MNWRAATPGHGETCDCSLCESAPASTTRFTWNDRLQSMLAALVMWVFA